MTVAAAPIQGPSLPSPLSEGGAILSALGRMPATETMTRTVTDPGTDPETATETEIKTEIETAAVTEIGTEIEIEIEDGIMIEARTGSGSGKIPVDLSIATALAGLMARLTSSPPSCLTSRASPGHHPLSD